MAAVLVIGGESTGGRLLARLLAGDDELDVDHYSMPHGAGDDRHWPTDVELESERYDAVLVTLRSWGPMLASKRENHRPDADDADLVEEVREAYARIIDWCKQRPFPWRFVLYEEILGAPEATVASVCEFLDRPPLPVVEPIEDGNAKWLTA